MPRWREEPPRGRPSRTRNPSSFFRQVREVVALLPREGVDIRTLFLEASDESLVRRYESSHRPHPLQHGQRILDGLAAERTLLADIRASADMVIDTTSINP